MATTQQLFVGVPAFVEVYEDGRWLQVAGGTTPEWLREVATEEAAMFPRVRIVSQFGTVLETVGRSS